MRKAWRARRRNTDLESRVRYSRGPSVATTIDEMPDSNSNKNNDSNT
jgi:hypothetical protein